MINSFQKTDLKTANQQLVKELNLSLILNLICRYSPVSRADLVKRTKLSPTTISSLVEELLLNDIVMETGARVTNTSGRKPIMVEINPAGSYILSYEIVEEGFSCLLYNLLCNEVDEYKIKLLSFNDAGIKMIEAAEVILKRNNIAQEKLIGISIGAPGLIDYKNNRIITSTVVSIKEENDFYNKIKERYSSIPVFLENESSFCAYAEKEFGIAGDIKNLIFIDINIGVGAGIIIDGCMFRGSYGMAGELGHISIDMNGPKCKCGSRGCLEIMAGIPAMIQKVIFAVMSGRETIIKDLSKNDYNKINMDVIKYALDQKDALAMEILDETAQRLALGINNIINLFNPQAIVIGGEISKLGDAFLNRLKTNLYSIEMKPNIERVVVKYSTLRGNAAALGGARYVFDNVFRRLGFTINKI